MNIREMQVSSESKQNNNKKVKINLAGLGTLPLI